MPRLWVHPALEACVGADEAEAMHVLVKPRVEPGEHAAGRDFTREQADPVPWRHRCPVNDVDLRAPLMSASSGQRGPTKNGPEPLVDAHGVVVSRPAVAIVEHLLAPELRVPDVGLGFDPSKGAERVKLETLGPGFRRHVQEGFDDPRLGGEARLDHLHHVGSDLTGQLEWVHGVSRLLAGPPRNPTQLLPPSPGDGTRVGAAGGCGRRSARSFRPWRG